MLFSTSAFSQFAVGLKAGVNIAKWDIKMSPTFNEDDIESILGLQGGLVAEYSLSPSIALQSELYFLRKGTDITVEDFDGMGTTFKQSNNFNYLEIPLLLKLRLNTSEDGIGFFGLIGPSFGYATSGEISTKTSSSGVSQELTESFEFGDNPDFQRAELSLALGAGINIPTGAGQVFIDARYLLGLTDLDKGDGETRNRGIGIGVGYLFNLIP